MSGTQQKRKTNSKVKTNIPQFQPVLSILQVMIVLMNVQIIAIPVTVRQDVPLVNKVTMAADVQRIVYTKHVFQI